MDIKPLFRISLIVNAVLSIIFIAIGILGAIGTSKQDMTAASAAIVILVLIFGSYSFFLLFDVMYYRVLKANNQNQVMPDWCNSYGKPIFILSIIAVIAASFILFAAAVAFLTEIKYFPERQRPFYILFLLLLCISVISAILNMVQYRRAIKSNKAIVNSLINNIGENQ